MTPDTLYAIAWGLVEVLVVLGFVLLVAITMRHGGSHD